MACADELQILAVCTSQPWQHQLDAIPAPAARYEQALLKNYDTLEQAMEPILALKDNTKT